MKTSLVTGAGGWIGLELVKQLLDDGQKVKALDRSFSVSLNKLKEQYKDRLLVIKGEMTKISDWKDELKDVDYLFHLAAKVHSKPNNKEEEKEFYLINRDCTKELFDIALEYKVGKVIFVSTVAVYGKHGNTVINVNTVRKPETPYAISKNEAEMYGLKLYENYKFPISIVQPVTVYGGNDRGNLKKLYNLAKKGIIVRFGNGENKKSVIYYKDLVEMLKNISKDSNTIGKIFICGTEVVTYNQIIYKFNSCFKRVVKAYIPNFISNICINIGNIVPISKLNNLSSNINTMMLENIYDIENSKKYISNYKFQTFETWECSNEYGNK